ncbi:plasma protease C1 inhibitor [Megalops cyprinoides]|uniref:plasma protease C1 inhibitor n=1 Tax=Megalops cyprinoides TaxID=118141 RepID=UPI0018652D9C|nr:plasma protease C1 inhibitor [Megalops cyprinoides]
MKLSVIASLFSLLLLTEGFFITLESSLYLPCLTVDAPKLNDPTLSWTFTPTSPPNSSTIPLSSTGDRVRVSQKDGHLSLSRVGLEDQGTYTCQVTGYLGDRMVKLKSSYPVEIYQARFELWELVEGQTGGKLRLPCSPPPPVLPASSRTTYQAVWYKVTQQGKERVFPRIRGELGEGSESRFSWSSSSHEKDDYSLEISDGTLEDSGVYQCDLVESRTLQKPVWSQKTELSVREPPTEPPPLCLDYISPWGDCVSESSRSGRAILQESLNEFSLKVYSQLREADKTQNLLFSPISIALVLTHLLLGADGDTRMHLENALSLPPSFSCLHNEIKNLRVELKDSVEIASNIYHSPELMLNDLFINQSKLFYSAVPEKLTNSSEKNVEMINNWVAEKTHHRIKELVDSMPQESLLALLNAVYFKGKWRVVFEGVNKNAPFVSLTGDVINTPVLYSSKYKLVQHYVPPLRAQVAEFPLSGKMSLYILLPSTPSAEGLQALEERMSPVTVKTMVETLSKVAPQMTEVMLPKIKLDIKTNLMDLLDGMGLTDLFDAPKLCGLTSMHTDTPLSLTDARHRAFLSLTEEGVEAGAVTSLSFSRSFPTFTALRPFVMVLWNHEVQSPLFMGRVTKP